MWLKYRLPLGYLLSDIWIPQSEKSVTQESHKILTCALIPGAFSYGASHGEMAFFTCDWFISFAIEVIIGYPAKAEETQTLDQVSERRCVDGI